MQYDGSTAKPAVSTVSFADATFEGVLGDKITINGKVFVFATSAVSGANTVIINADMTAAAIAAAFKSAVSSATAAGVSVAINGTTVTITNKTKGKVENFVSVQDANDNQKPGSAGPADEFDFDTRLTAGAAAAVKTALTKVMASGASITGADLTALKEAFDGLTVTASVVVSGSAEALTIKIGDALKKLGTSATKDQIAKVLQDAFNDAVTE